jgi:hypothetical protein
MQPVQQLPAAGIGQGTEDSIVIHEHQYATI